MSTLQLIKRHGGKGRLKQFIISHFPPNYENLIYLEPFIGSGVIGLNKKPSTIEIFSDLDQDLILLYKEVKYGPKTLIQKLSRLIYDKSTFDFYANIMYDIPVREYVLSRMSRGGLGTHFSQSSRLRGGQEEGKNAWENSIKQIPNISNRLQNVTLFNCDFRRELIAHNWIENIFTYLDPPYMSETRSVKDCYKHEMSTKDHQDLLDIITAWKGKVLISGYESGLYTGTFKNWNRFEKICANNSGQNRKKNKRVEVLWRNF